jgi:hypothetical protein
MRVLPHITELMVTEISEATQWADVIVVTARDPAYDEALQKLRSEQTVLDFAGLEGTESAKGGKIHGFLW